MPAFPNLFFTFCNNLKFCLDSETKSLTGIEVSPAEFGKKIHPNELTLIFHIY